MANIYHVHVHVVVVVVVVMMMMMMLVMVMVTVVVVVAAAALFLRNNMSTNSNLVFPVNLVNKNKEFHKLEYRYGRSHKICNSAETARKPPMA